MKQKILFMMIDMNVGGTEKAFLNLVSEMDFTKYGVTLLLLEAKGGFLKDVPKEVQIETLENYEQIKDEIMLPPLECAKKFWKLKNYSESVGILLHHFIFKISKDRTSYYKFLLRKFDKRKKYDVAVAFAGPMDFITTYVLEKVEADKKIQWIHFDVSKNGISVKYAKRNYPKFHKVFVVSDQARQSLIHVIPQIEKKTETKHNIVSEKMCLHQAENGETYREYKGIKILTVGRLYREKGQDIIPEVARQLKREGYDFKWYLIGEGSIRKEIEKKIEEYELKDTVILLGTKTNPYRFYKDATIYVQTSRHEGFGITIAEAKVFKLPIVSTDVAGAREQLKEKNEIIVQFAPDELAKGIKKLLEKSRG